MSSVEGWSGIYQALYEENQIALLPFLAVALQMNSTDMLSPIFSDGYGSALGLGDGMSMSVECSELPYSWDLEKETEIIENPVTGPKSYLHLIAPTAVSGLWNL